MNQQLSMFDYSTCNHSNLVEKVEPEGSLHFARLICHDCRKFIKWLPRPKTPDISVVRLLHGTGLEDWEHHFLKAIAHRSLTKAEIIVIEAIQAKVKPVVGRASG